MSEVMLKSLISTTTAKDINTYRLQRELQDRNATRTEIKNVSKIYGDRLIEKFEQIKSTINRSLTFEEKMNLNEECILYALEQFKRGRQNTKNDP